MAETPLLRLHGALASSEALRARARTMLGVAAGRGHWIAQRNGTTAAIIGNPELRAGGNKNVDANLAERLLDAFDTHGAAALEHVRGSFALAVVDPARRYALLAVDRMGIEAMAYAVVERDVVFASRADWVAGVLGRASEVDPQAVFDYLFFHMVPAPQTIYRGVRKLLPGQFAEYRDGALRLDFYWRMHYVDRPTMSEVELTRQFRALLPGAVARQLDGRKAGTFLSGGTDSSTVTGILSTLQKEPVDAYSIGFQAEGFDEMAYARLAAQRYAVKHHSYYVTPADVVAAVPRVAAAYDEPFGNASAVAVYHCALQARRQGTQIMLAGDGGDELFGGNARYAKQKIFEAYGTIPAALRSHLLEPLARRAPGMRKVRSYIEQATVPLPDRLESYNFLFRADLASMLAPEFQAAVRPDHPFSQMREVYERTDSRSPINRMMHLDLKQTLADNDLRKVNVMCRLAGVDVRYPMLDDDLVAFSGLVPPSGKVRGLQLRHFFKQALKDFLPAEILIKTKHGFGLPFGIWMLDYRPLYELAGDSLSSFRARGYLRGAYLDQLLAQHRSGHASYYGVMVWVILMLEQWFQSRQPFHGGSGPAPAALPPVNAYV
jgi:asparagine synthase (glutamine-hydrolysing)